MIDNSSQEPGKSPSSDSDTRNPTTNKKVVFYTPSRKHQQHYYSPNNPNQPNVQFQNRKLKNKFQRLHKSMYQMKDRKQQCIRASRYQEAKFLQHQINFIERKKAKTEAKNLFSEHKRQRKLIKKAHRNQMAKFKEVWQNYFIGLKAKEQTTMINFRNSREKYIKVVQEELIEKCKSLKVSNGELKSLQKKQRILKKQDKLQELLELKKQKKNLKQRLIELQQQKIYNWAKKEEDFLKAFHTKKYNALVNRIEETYNDKCRQYQREGHRLRLKYHNVMKKLQHEHKIELNQLLQRYSFLKVELKGKLLTTVEG